MASKHARNHEARSPRIKEKKKKKKEEEEEEEAEEKSFFSIQTVLIYLRWRKQCGRLLKKRLM